MSDMTEFQKELKALLEKYDVTICANYSGDTHGIHDEYISFDHGCTEHRIVDGLSLSSYDLDDLDDMDDQDDQE